jgi:tRNA(adenine34) deaminase
VDDVRWMRLALEQARDAELAGEVPVGAVVVQENTLLAASANRTVRDHDPTAHAEILALREASRVLDSWRLSACALYVTLEPCAMCAGAIVLARVPRLVFGATDPKAGACGSVLDVTGEARLNHRPQVAGDLLAPECGELLSSFFVSRR